MFGWASFTPDSKGCYVLVDGSGLQHRSGGGRDRESMVASATHPSRDSRIGTSLLADKHALLAAYNAADL